MNINNLRKYDCIYVIGHANPDADSIFSSYVLSKILISKGINAKFAILDKTYKYSYEDEELINCYLQEKPVIINENETKNLNFILVDHNDPEQSIKNGNAILAIDHHINTNKIKECYTEEYTSTLLYIYDIFRNEYDFSEYEKKLVALTVICDSGYLTSTRFSSKDKVLYEELGQAIDIKELREKFFKTTDFSDDIEVIFNNNFKVYNIDDKIINRVSVKAYKSDISYFKKYRDYLTSLDGIWLLIWCEYDTNKTYVLIKNNNDVNSIEYDYILTSSVLIIKDLIKRNII